MGGEEACVCETPNGMTKRNSGETFAKGSHAPHGNRFLFSIISYNEDHINLSPCAFHPIISIRTWIPAHQQPIIIILHVTQIVGTTLPLSVTHIFIWSTRVQFLSISWMKLFSNSQYLSWRGKLYACEMLHTPAGHILKALTCWPPLTSWPPPWMCFSLLFSVIDLHMCVSWYICMSVYVRLCAFSRPCMFQFYISIFFSWCVCVCWLTYLPECTSAYMRVWM